MHRISAHFLPFHPSGRFACVPDLQFLFEHPTQTVWRIPRTTSHTHCSEMMKSKRVISWGWFYVSVSANSASRMFSSKALHPFAYGLKLYPGSFCCCYCSCWWKRGHQQSNSEWKFMDYSASLVAVARICAVAWHLCPAAESFLPTRRWSLLMIREWWIFAMRLRNVNAMRHGTWKGRDGSQREHTSTTFLSARVDERERESHKCPPRIERILFRTPAAGVSENRADCRKHASKFHFHFFGMDVV